VSIEARVGEQVGCACAFVNSTPLFFSAVMFGIGACVPPVAVSGKLSAPRSSAMMTRMFEGCAKRRPWSQEGKTWLSCRECARSYLMTG